jgi:hypothetical protein
MRIIGYVVFLFALIWLCQALPLIGYPIAVIVVIRMLFYGKSGAGEVLDTEPPDHHHH